MSMNMMVKEIEKGKRACVLIEFGQAHVYYPKRGNENEPESMCSCMRLEWQGASGCDDDDDETQSDQEAVFEAAMLLDIPEEEIELAYS